MTVAMFGTTGNVVAGTLSPVVRLTPSFTLFGMPDMLHMAMQQCVLLMAPWSLGPSGCSVPICFIATTYHPQHKALATLLTVEMGKGRIQQSGDRGTDLEKGDRHSHDPCILPPLSASALILPSSIRLKQTPVTPSLWQVWKAKYPETSPWVDPQVVMV